MGTPTYTLIQEQVLGSASASVTFSSIPQTYKDLVVEVIGTAGLATNVDYRFNGDTATNYSYTQLTGTGTSAASYRATSQSNGRLDNYGYFDTTMGCNIAQVMSYANTSVYKTTLSRGNNTANGVSAVVNLWRSTSAVTSITLIANGTTFSTGCTFRLWGVVG